MKKTLLLKTLLLLCAIIVGSTSAKADDFEEVYTFSIIKPSSGAVSDYTKTGDMTIDGITWTVPGNWYANGALRLGGKSLDKVNRTITGKGAITKAVSKLTFNHTGNTSDNLVLNSVKVTVASDASFNNVIETKTVTPTYSKNTAGSFDITPTASVWPANSYYKFDFNMSNSNNSNYAFVLNSIVFYENNANKVATTTTIDDSDLTNTDVYVGTAAGALSAAVTVTEGGAAVAGATVSWESSDENVATIDENGAVTLVAVGTTTITATYNGDATHISSTDTYELTVTSSQPKQPYYLVTDASQLADGDKIIIVYDDEALSTEQKTSNRSATGFTKEADGSILLVIDTDVQVLTLEKTTVTKENVTSDAWYLQTTGDNYLYASSNSSNQLKTAKKSTVGDNGKAAFSFSGDNALIAFQGSNGRNELRYNYNNGTPIFNCYASSSTTGDAVQIYKATATIAINEACKEGEKYYATYSSTKPFVVPNDITVSSVAVDGEGNLVITDFTQGETVPANYGVLVSAATAGEKKVYYSNDAGTSHADQMLYASSEGLTAAEMATAAPNCEYYRLTMHNGTIIGFWWGAENGDSFAIAANKAYLAVPKGATAKAGFAFNENVANGINALDTQHPTPNTQHPIYNLAGQHVNKSYKGVVIVNGKKMLNK